MRITKAHLEAKIATINEMTGNPTEAYTRTDSGLKVNVGHYLLDKGYGGYSFAQITNDKGGERNIINGRFSGKEMANILDAYRFGLMDAK